MVALIVDPEAVHSACQGTDLEEIEDDMILYTPYDLLHVVGGVFLFTMQLGLLSDG